MSEWRFRRRCVSPAPPLRERVSISVGDGSQLLAAERGWVFCPTCSASEREATASAFSTCLEELVFLPRNLDYRRTPTRFFVVSIYLLRFSGSRACYPCQPGRGGVKTFDFTKPLRSLGVLLYQSCLRLFASKAVRRWLSQVVGFNKRNLINVSERIIEKRKKQKRKKCAYPMHSACVSHQLKKKQFYIDRMVVTTRSVFRLSSNVFDFVG